MCKNSAISPLESERERHWPRLPPQRSTHLAQEYRDDLLMMHMVYMMMYGVIRREAPQLCMFDLPSPPPSLKE